jgi:hypothetical protein
MITAPVFAVRIERPGGSIQTDADIPGIMSESCPEAWLCRTQAIEPLEAATDPACSTILLIKLNP